MPRIGYLFFALVVAALSGSAWAQLDSEKRAFLKQLASVNRSEAYTALDIDSFCNHTLSVDQLAGLVKTVEFSELAKLRAAENTARYYERMYAYSCPAVAVGVTELAAKSKR